jgi:hypothetical protein
LNQGDEAIQGLCSGLKSYSRQQMGFHPKFFCEKMDLVLDLDFFFRGKKYLNLLLREVKVCWWILKENFLFQWRY